jgi:Type IIA topoisomerase (DNA gyrase/topo II, topoisomerase IV), B subunit
MNESPSTHIDAIRLRPAMYVGSTSVYGFNHLLLGIFRYAVDYLKAKEFSFRVTGKMSGEIAFSNMGSLFNDNVLIEQVEPPPTQQFGVYEIAALNALSSSFQTQIEIVDESTRTIEFSKGVCRSGIIAKEDLRASKISIFFELDTSIWALDSYLYPYFYLDFLQTLAFLNKGKSIGFGFGRDDRDSAVRFEFEGGLSDLLEIKRLSSIYGSFYFPTSLEIDSDSFTAEIAFGFWGNSINIPYQASFVNHERSQENGVHFDSVFTGVHSAINTYFAKGMSANEDDAISETAISRSLNCLVHVKMARPVFEGSIKGKLLSPEIAKPIIEAVRAELWRKMNTSRPQADELIRHLSRNWKLNA